MSKTFKLKNGFDSKRVGRAGKELLNFQPARTCALKPTDFVGRQRPKVLVSEGDLVKAGTPILFDRKEEKVVYVAPVSGKVVGVVRGEKRRLLEISILSDGRIEYEQFTKFSEA